MARTLDPVAHAVRRDAFLDTAQRLIQTKGYAQMSIQDVLDDLSVSKGAFYHYFGSKAALLEGVAARMVDASIAELAPMVADPHSCALDKFDGLFTGLARFKAARKELILALMKVWLSDDNVLAREKVRRATITHLTPLLASIIEQGVAEGAFTIAASPTHSARVFAALALGANEAAVDLFFAYQDGTVSLEEVERALAAFGDAFERILGASHGALGFTNHLAVLREWLDDPAPATLGTPPTNHKDRA